MNRIVFLASVACVLSWGVAAQAEELPKRKAGLWESTVSGGMAPAPQVIKQCIDEKTDSLAMAAVGGGNCKPPTITKTSAGYETETSCQFGQMTSTAKSVISGDFSSKITAKTTATIVQAPGQQPVTSNTTIEAKYLGPCAADQKPGDIIMPDGKVVRTPGTK
ncbi:DUF3617 family protein [Reyranella sp. CPCC 100927]|uniref:DUF3617 domain-containing protein n=1 Tax=Reyranella sp. CPCC 100927 TaxID=2599616 RepID=UPI0011B49153|nr:DUF3617 family protein [Reyranella sp. CPCC 100927]TWT15347.1 DUF3617 family protein [Reyranella sp. CPCC 100927]